MRHELIFPGTDSERSSCMNSIVLYTGWGCFSWCAWAWGGNCAWFGCMKANATDSLSSIAARHKTTTSELVHINRLMTNMIFPGQVGRSPRSQ